MRPMKAMIFAAGIGTRLIPFTDKYPKALLPLRNKPILEYIIQYLKLHGIEEIIINVHHHSQQILDFLKEHHNFNIRIEISDETDALLNTGGGLKKASWFFDSKEPFFLLTCDVLTNLNLQDFYRYHKKKNSLVSLWVKGRATSRVLLFDESYHLCGWENKETSASQFVKNHNHYAKKIAFGTIHLIDPKLFSLIEEKGPFSIISLYMRLAERYPIIGYENNTPLWMEFGRIKKIPVQEKSKELDIIMDYIYGKNY